MVNAAIITGLLLVAIGVGGFAGAGFATSAVTALIPAVFGLLIGFCGALASRESRRKAATRAAAVLAFLGFLLSAGRIGMVLSKGSFVWELRNVSLLVMSVVCLAFLLLCVQQLLKSRHVETP